MTTHSRSTWMRAAAFSLVIAAAAGGFIWWRVLSQRVYIDIAHITAPQIDLAPSQGGVLQQVYVQEGDTVGAHQTVARVGDELLQAKIAGVIISVNQKIGAQVSTGSSIVSMIDPTQLRTVGELDEDKGLNKLKVGDQVVFTVDAFGGKPYTGVVDEVSPTSKQSGVVFNISDQREVKQFYVKARFDTSAYPELKNGMSARMWVYVQ